MKMEMYSKYKTCVSHNFIRISFTIVHIYSVGSSVIIATGYGLQGPEIESRWRRDFPHLSIPALGPTQPHVRSVQGLFPGVNSGQGVTLKPHPYLVPLVMKE
jgi:hypothetical protein